MAIARPHRTTLQIDSDPYGRPPFSEKYQKYKQHQDEQIASPLSTPVDYADPAR